MDAERKKYLERNMDARLTSEEVQDGWCFCVAWDGMLLKVSHLGAPNPEACDCCDADCPAKQSVRNTP